MKPIATLLVTLVLAAVTTTPSQAEPLPARRKASSALGNHAHFARWAEYQAHLKLTGDDRCTRVGLGESMTGEFRRAGEQLDLHILQISRCSGRRPPIALYWGLYRGNDFIAGAELTSLPFFSALHYVDFPADGHGGERAALKGFEKEEGSCMEHRLTFGWDGEGMIVVEHRRNKAEARDVHRCR